MVAEIRDFLQERGFLEVETPMLQDVAGGAAARPFETHHNALGMPLTLRIAPELFLKRLLVGGFTKIFELNRNFRNEGISRRHNPEFTMLEAYWAFADFEEMAELVEELDLPPRGEILRRPEDRAQGRGRQRHPHHRPRPAVEARDLSRPHRRPSPATISSTSLPTNAAPGATNSASRSPAAWRTTRSSNRSSRRRSRNTPSIPASSPACRPRLVPLAKVTPGGKTVEVYELIINGQEISPGYSELNDPDVQRQRLEHQAGGEEEQKVDYDFIETLEHGMPPAGGIGIGIDRLIMMLTGADPSATSSSSPN